MNELDGTYYLIELVKKLNNDRNSINYIGSFTITAIVDEIEKVSKDDIECQLKIEHDSVDISIFWEEYGYKGYQRYGVIWEN